MSEFAPEADISRHDKIDANDPKPTPAAYMSGKQHIENADKTLRHRDAVRYGTPQNLESSLGKNLSAFDKTKAQQSLPREFQHDHALLCLDRRRQGADGP